MNPPGNSTGGETPPSSENQTQLQWPGQQTLIANNESHIMNEPSLTLYDAGGRRAPLWWPQRLEEPRQTPFIANQESHITDEPFLPPHHATDDRRTPPSLTVRLGIGEPHQTPRIANQESHNINQPFQPPQHHAANGRITPPSPSSPKQLGIQEPSQPPSRVNNESLTIRQPSRPLHFAGRTTELQALNDKLLDMLSKRYKLQNQQNALRVNQESHTIKKPSRVNQESHTMKKPSSSSEGRRGGVVALRCAKCKNTSTTQWRSDPTCKKSLCNACWNRLNRVDETRDASGLQSWNTLPPARSSSAALARFLHEVRNRVELVENNANPFMPENNFLGHSSGLQSSNIVWLPPEFSPPAAPSLANSVQLVENISGLQSSSPLRGPPVVTSKMEEFRQNRTDKSDKTPDKSPGA